MESKIDSIQLQLLTDCKEGAEGGFERLYKHFYSFSMSVCYRYVRNEGEAMEIVNDSFLNIYKKIDSFDLSRPFKPWLRRILVNNSINYIKKNSKYLPVDSDEYFEAETASVENDGVQNLSYKELLDLVQELSPAYRAVFNMYVIDGYNHEEIAERLNISINTSKSNLSRAREGLRKKLKKSQLQAVTTGKLWKTKN